MSEMSVTPATMIETAAPSPEARSQARLSNAPMAVELSGVNKG